MRAIANASPPLLPGPAKTTILYDLSQRWMMAFVNAQAARSIRSMEAIGSWVMVYLSNSFNWEQERIFMLILRFAYKDNTICKKRVGKILILGIKILFLHQLID